MNNTCVICLDNMDESIYKCNKCNNNFHIDCIKKLKKKLCPLCRTCITITDNSDYNVTFNNMDETNRIYDINFYINKWYDKDCLNNKHHFILETLGDWIMDDDDLKFKYKCMYLECTICKKHRIIN